MKLLLNSQVRDNILLFLGFILSVYAHAQDLCQVNRLLKDSDYSRQLHKITNTDY